MGDLGWFPEARSQASLWWQHRRILAGVILATIFMGAAYWFGALTWIHYSNNPSIGLEHFSFSLSGDKYSNYLTRDGVVFGLGKNYIELWGELSLSRYTWANDPKILVNIIAQNTSDYSGTIARSRVRKLVHNGVFILKKESLIEGAFDNKGNPIVASKPDLIATYVLSDSYNSLSELRKWLRSGDIVQIGLDTDNKVAFILVRKLTNRI